MKFKNERGQPQCRSTGYRRGQETQARELAAEVERQAAMRREAIAPVLAAVPTMHSAVVSEPIVTPAQVAAPIAADRLRPRHIRDLINALKQKTSDARRCKGERLAPRPVRHVLGLLRRMFKSAVIDEHIAASPVVLEKGTLPKNVDKDPTWRSTAIFEREELVTLISDGRIPRYRQLMNALEGLAGLRTP